MLIRPPSSLVRTLAVCAGGAAAIAGLAALHAPAHADILVAWGRDDFGQLGDGAATATPRATAATVLGLNRMYAAGRGPLGDMFVEGLGVAIQDGAVYRWGAVYLGTDENEEPITGADPIPDIVLGMESGVTLVAAQGHAVKNGVLVRYSTWGSLTPVPPPQPVAGAPANITAFSISDYTGVNLAQNNSGLWSWGSNQFGQLGDGSPVSMTGRATPALIPGFESGVTDFAADDWHCVALKNGVVYTWGKNFGGSLGQGPLPGEGVVLTPTPVAGPLGTGGVTAIASYAHCTLAVRDGLVYSWGWPLNGQLGYAVTGSTDVPALVPGPHDIIDVSKNEYASFALSADGSIWTWGGNNANLNLGHTFPSGMTPRQVLPPAGYRFTGVRGSTTFTLATIAPMCPADFGSAGGVLAPDSQLDNNDFIAFIDAFFTRDPLADIGAAGAAATPDGAFDNNDFIVFIGLFFGGC